MILGCNALAARSPLNFPIGPIRLWHRSGEHAGQLRFVAFTNKKACVAHWNFALIPIANLNQSRLQTRRSAFQWNNSIACRQLGKPLATSTFKLEAWIWPTCQLDIFWCPIIPANSASRRQNMQCGTDDGDMACKTKEERFSFSHIFPLPTCDTDPRLLRSSLLISPTIMLRSTMSVYLTLAPTTVSAPRPLQKKLR